MIRQAWLRHHFITTTTTLHTKKVYEKIKISFRTDFVVVVVVAIIAAAAAAAAIV